MNKQYFLLIVILFISKISYNQTKNYKIVYRHCVQLDTTKTLLDTLGTEAILVGNNKSSNYCYYKKPSKNEVITGEKNKPIEDLIAEKESGTVRISMGIMSDEMGNMVYHDKISDSIFVREKMINEYVITTEKTPYIEWKLLEETKLIKSYKCHKAMAYYRGRNYTAWFTTDIQIIDAPWKFYGLPGLIMDIYDDKFQVKLYAESIEYPTTSPIEPFFVNGTKISLQDYFSFKNNEMLNRSKSLSSLLSNQENIYYTDLRPKVRMRGAIFGIEKKID